MIEFALVAMVVGVVWGAVLEARQQHDVHQMKRMMRQARSDKL